MFSTAPTIVSRLGGIGAAAPRRARGAIPEAMIGLNDYAIKLIYVDVIIGSCEKTIMAVYLVSRN
jgi:hypothetical protein